MFIHALHVLMGPTRELVTVSTFRKQDVGIRRHGRQTLTFHLCFAVCFEILAT